MNITNSTVRDIFTARGFQPTEVRISRNGYRITFSDRAEAFSAARTIINAFEEDAEAGWPTIQITPADSDEGGFTVLVDIYPI